jgi:uncharacterized Ntn-hydrolase superfamily protein
LVRKISEVIQAFVKPVVVTVNYFLGCLQRLFSQKKCDSHHGIYWRNEMRVFGLVMSLIVSLGARAQEPAQWGEELVFNTFSIAAIDPSTGETGVAVTTRNACVGNGVPWVRVGVGAVATQARTRTEYGSELLDLLEQGMSAEEALKKALSADEDAANRQVGVIGLAGGSAQHTGEETNDWAGGRSGPNYVTQGNLLVGPEVLDAVAQSFESTEGSHRHLSDRLIEALAAGQAAGGDARKGRLQSAAVIVADPTPGRSRRPDKVTVNINVCEHPHPVAELRRIYDNISQTLGFRTLQMFSGRDVWQLKLVLHALGHFRPDRDLGERRDRDAFLYTREVIDAVEKFRAAKGLANSDNGTPPGLVDAATVEHLWAALERTGKADEVREQIRELTIIRR